jgi:serine/threonine-protein kinase
MAIAYKHLHERVPAPSSRNPAVPPSLDGWVASMTERERELRPESAAEARRDLEVERRALPPAKDLGSLVPEVAVLPIAPSPGRATTVTIPRSHARRRPRRRRIRWALGILLGLAALAAAAWGAWTYLIPHEVDVPDVVGSDVDEARQRLEGLGLVVRIDPGEYSKRLDEGTVLRTQPGAGTTLEEGDRVVLIPSLGPPPVPVPNLQGATIPEARTMLRESDLRLGKVTREYSDEVPADRVIGQSERGEAPFGSEVDVVVSKGPVPVPVPKVTKLTQEEASAALTDAGFLVSAVEEYSDQVPRGVVISQDPPRGTRIQPGNTVTIVVSLGPERFELPSFLGMSTQEAEARLLELGLVPRILPIPGGNGDTVATHLPVSGTTVRVGDSITLYVL